MGERNLARLAAQTAAHQGRQRGRMVRVAERPFPQQLALAQHAGDRVDHADLERLAWIERREQSQQALRRPRLSRAPTLVLRAPGGLILRRLGPPAPATSSARLAVSWPLMSLRSSRAPCISA